MDGWQGDLLHSLLTMRDEWELLEKLSSLARGLGFEYCAYGMRSPVPLSRPQIIMLNNYPLDWQTLYRQNGYLAIDPTLKHGMRTSLPLLWRDELFISARELWEEARSFGLRFGWAQSSWDAQRIGGMLTLARADEPLTEAELREKSASMSWLVQAAHIGMSRCLAPRLLPDAEIHLTERELTVLRWTADGKTSGEISAILGISERTVNFHANNASEKLGAANKLAATVKAAVLGML